MSIVAHAITNWKTTVNGVLAFLIATLTTVSGFLVAGDVTTGGVNAGAIHVSTWVVVSINIALALCRVWVGMLQTDSGKTTAVVPGNPAPVAVPSHEVPNDPAATPVIPPKP